MRIGFALWLLAGVLPLAAPASAAPAVAPATQPSAEALALARLMAPRQVMIDGEVRQFDINFSKTLLSREEVAAAEAKYPGLVAAMAEASRPLLIRQTGGRLDRLYPRVAGLIQAELTPAEIAELTSFFGSPAGRNILEKMAQSVDASPVYEQAAKDGQVTEDAVKVQQWMTAMNAVGKFSDADRAALADLRKRPVFAKLSQLQTKFRTMMIETMGGSDPAYEKEIEAAMSAAVAAHLEKLGAKPRK